IVGAGTIGEIAQRRYRRVVVEVADPAAAIELPGCELVDRTGGRATFSHHGEVGPLLAALAALAPRDVRIQEASLDEVFMEYYGEAAP
ncbi:MAG: hypothetical protein ACKO7U_03670, partial [Actinomycetota bacterium]